MLAPAVKRTRGFMLAGTALATVLLCGAAGLLYARFVGSSQLRFVYSAAPLESTAYARMASAPGWAADEIEVAGGVSLRGLVRRPTSANAPWILYYPGNDATQLATSQKFLTRVLGEQDYGLAAYAYRGYDASGGTLDGAEHSADATRIIRHLTTRHHVAPERIHVVGFSLGGYFAVTAAEALARDKTPAASLSLLASIDDISMVRPSLWQRLDPGHGYVTSELFNDVSGPVLVLQGDADEAFHGPSQGRALAAGLGARGRYLELPGVGHSALLENDKAIAELRAHIASKSSLP